MATLILSKTGIFCLLFILFPSAFPKGHLGCFEPADFANGLLKFYSLNKSVKSEKWGPRPSTGHRNVSLLRRLTPDVIKWFQYKLTAIRAVRFNESLHSCTFLCSLIRVWKGFFFPCGRPTRIPQTSSHGGLKKGSSSAFYHRLFAGSCAGISSLCLVVDWIVIQQKKTLADQFRPAACKAGSAGQIR